MLIWFKKTMNKKKKVLSLKVEVPTLSRRAIVADKQLLSKQVNSTLDKIKIAITNSKIISDNMKN